MNRFFPVLTATEATERILKEATPDRVGLVYISASWVNGLIRSLGYSYERQKKDVWVNTSGMLTVCDSKIYIRTDAMSTAELEVDYCVVEEGLYLWDKMESRIRVQASDISGSRVDHRPDIPQFDDDIVFGGTSS